MLFSIWTRDRSPLTRPNKLFIWNLDFTEVNTDLLIDKGLGIAKYEEYDGNLNNTVEADINSFGVVYADICSAALNADAILPSPDNYVEASKNYKQGEDVSFVFLAYEYDAIIKSGNLIKH